MTVKELNEIKHALEINEIRADLKHLQEQIHEFNKRFNKFWYRVFVAVSLPVAAAIIINLVV